MRATIWNFYNVIFSLCQTYDNAWISGEGSGCLCTDDKGLSDWLFYDTFILWFIVCPPHPPFYEDS